MTDTSKSATTKRKLFIRIASDSLNVARLAANATDFEAATLPLSPTASLTANVRQALINSALCTGITDAQVLVSGPTTFVPLAEFQEEDCEGLYDVCFPHEGVTRRRVFYDIVPSTNCVALFALDENVCRSIEDLLGLTPHYVSAFTSLIRHYAAKPVIPRPGHKRFFVYTHGEHADIVVLEGGRLLHACGYTVGSVADVAYYALALARSLGANVVSPATSQGETVVVPDTFYVVADERGDIDKTVDELRQYAADVLPIIPSAEFNRHSAASNPDIPYDLLTFLIP